ncbi:MAG: class II aldolase/adducin family protein [Lachnospiraceae bacterium]
MERELLADKIEQAIWAANSLFARGKTAGSSANLSFRHDRHIYISGSGTCFGSLKPEQFAVVDIDGTFVSGARPSKEMPLHLMLYQSSGKVQAVIHTHSFYSVLWSCLKHSDEADIVPQYTPYLKMKVGKIGLIPYRPPGSEALFHEFKQQLGKSDGYLLANHGPVIAGTSIREAFYGLEELEESTKLAYFIERSKQQNIFFQAIE